MSFIYCDADTGELVDIVEDRRLASSKAYFLHFPRKVRNKVKHIVIDMYTPYITLIKEVFPKAKIVLDKFHIVQLISRALNKTRIKMMNQDKKNYNKLNRYWRLLLKRRSKVDFKNYKHYTCFKGLMCEEDVLNYLLSTSKELKDTYEIYQDLLSCIDTKLKDNDEIQHSLSKEQKKSRWINILNNYRNNSKEQGAPSISSYMKTSLNSLISYQEYILNMMDTGYTSGPLEGLNNKIKVIKRIAFGYRSFLNLKARIIITQKMHQIQKGSSNLKVA